MDFESLSIDTYPIDDELADAGTVGPELAHLSHIYVRSPRALIWRNPSSEWRLFVVLLPLASRLSLMRNPIFAQLARAWGLNIRFIGVDRHQLVYDFRALLSDRAIHLLVDALAQTLHPIALASQPRHRADDALDVLFAALAGDLLTVLDHRRDDWGRHLVRDHRLDPDQPDSLFDRPTRYPDFLAKLREALRNEIIDVEFYGRALRSIDLREAAVEQRLASLIEGSLDPITFAKLSRTAAVGHHLGCYNWLRLDPRHAAARAYALSRLPSMASFFADSLVTLETMPAALVIDDPRDPSADAAGTSPDAASAMRDAAASQPADATVPLPAEALRLRQVPTLDLRQLAARADTLHALRCSELLKRAIDAGQDRAIIEALAQRFAVADNVIRRLWREQPRALGARPTWHLAQILRRLNELPERQWPADDSAWRELMAQAVPAEAG
ncbi:MAG TPA: hypothetical protein PKA20_20410 [Burkholderiaceae bacterium]|nr:hypothetical protein [Burkholderiaceae bacterium]